MNSPLPHSQSRGFFPTTSWTVVSSLSGSEQTFRILAWEEFCDAYWHPLHKWLMLRGVSHETAEDLVQGFFAKLHSSPLSIAELNPAKGRLRSFLLASLRNLWIDHIRSVKSIRNGNTCGLTRACEEAADTQDEAAFDREWAMTILSRSVAILRDEYAARGNETLFNSLLPLVESDDPASRERASSRCGLVGNTFNVALKRLRERLAIRLRCEVSATLLNADDTEINDELRHLIVVLGRSGFGEALGRSAGTH